MKLRNDSTEKTKPNKYIDYEQTYTQAGKSGPNSLYL
jgi:hypothetical protein